MTTSLLLLVAGAAQAARLSTCEVRLELPGGEATVTGHGADEAAARARGRRLALAVAEAHRHGELLVGAFTAPGRTLSRVHADLPRTAPAGGPAPRSTTYGLFDGGCTLENLPADKGNAWQATWDGGESVLRSEPGLAVEAARRRTCFGRWQHAVREWAVTLDAGAPLDDGGSLLALSDAGDELVRCTSRGGRTLGLAVAPLPAPPPVELVACSRPRRADGAWLLTSGWGSTLEEAREAALARDLHVTVRQAAGDLSGALAGSGREVARRALQPLEALVVGTDLAEQALLLCRGGAEAEVDYAWAPSAEVRSGCGEPPPPSTLRATATALEGLVGDRCDQVREATLRPLGAVEVAGKEALIARGLAAAASCAASCARDVQILRWAGSPLHREGEPDRTTPAAAAGALQSALRAHDFDAFAILTGGVLFEPRYAVVALKSPQAFWASLDEAVAAGRFETTTEWHGVLDHWLLVFKGQ